MVIPINGIDIHYEIFGEGEETLFILHGWMASINAMAPIWQYFQMTRRVVVLDFPGQGGTSGQLKKAWGVPEYAEMVKEFMEKIGITQPDVIGHSFGGRVIIYLASTYPTLFHKIILTDAAGLKKKTTISKWMKIKSYKMGKFFLRVFYPKEKREEKINALRKKYGSSDYASLSSDIMRETFQKVIHLDLKENLKKIESPCLLIWGESDEDTPLYMAKTMEKEIKDSGLVVLKNAGHFSYLDATSQYNKIVETFLQSE